MKVKWGYKVNHCYVPICGTQLLAFHVHKTDLSVSRDTGISFQLYVAQNAKALSKMQAS